MTDKKNEGQVRKLTPEEVREAERDGLNAEEEGAGEEGTNEEDSGGVIEGGKQGGKTGGGNG